MHLLLTEAVSQEKWNKGVGAGDEELRKNVLISSGELKLIAGDSLDHLDSLDHSYTMECALACYEGKGPSAVPSCCDPASRLLGKKPTMSHQAATTLLVFVVQLYSLVKVIET